MLPVYERLDTKSFLRIPFSRFALATVALPLSAFIFCIVWSLIFNFEEANYTHCQVRNYLPSISAVTGGYQPQKFVWQTAIAIHFVPRLMVSRIYLKYFDSNIRRNRRALGYLAVTLNVIENISLVGLSFYPSPTNFTYHRNFFVVFIATSEVYMTLSYLLNKNARKVPEMTKIEMKSLKFKRNLLLLNVTCFAIAGYLYMRHNNYCEPGIFTLFSFFEYIVVLTNMGYHLTSYWDFADRYLLFDKAYGFYFSTS